MNNDAIKFHPELTVQDSIAYFLQRHALGRERAVPRKAVLAYLWERGFRISDRTLRRTYADMPLIGFVVDGDCKGERKHRGLFWIRTTREALDMEETRRRLGKANMRHAKQTAVAHANLNQREMRVGA
ncbi:MAG: hypothetical protein WC455_19185 [Dehalococcoidia bacterium]|jgi:hypothetical protein